MNAKHTEHLIPEHQLRPKGLALLSAGPYPIKVAVQVLVTPFPTLLPANAPSKAAEGGPSAWIPATTCET